MRDVKKTARKIRRRDKEYRIAKTILLILIILLFITYCGASLVYNGYNFTISLDSTLYYDRGIIIYDSTDYKVYRQFLVAEAMERVDNISERWIAADVDGNYEGSHNGNNYLAYTFFVENIGEDATNYYLDYLFDDVIKELDDAVRMKIYYDGNPTTYAKLSKRGTPEVGTVPFIDDTVIMRQDVMNFQPGQIHKYTVVIWIEGDDEDCTNNLIGGEIRSHIEIKSERIEER